MNKKFIEMYNANTMEELKKAYKEYAFRYHPDMGGSTSDMQELNNLYETLREKLLKNMDTESYDYKNYSRESASAYMDMIYDIVHIVGLHIEITGTWIWLNTDDISEDDYKYLYSIGFRWSKAKKLMYKDMTKTIEQMDEMYRNRRKHKGKSMDSIRSTYGSVKIDIEDTTKRLK